MSGFVYKQTGTQELIDRLFQAPKKLAKAGMMKVGRAGANLIKQSLIQAAPQRTGTWKRSVGVKIKLYDDGKRMWFAVGPRSDFFAMITYAPDLKSASWQRFQMAGKKGQKTNKERGEREERAIGSDHERSVRPIKKSKKGIPDGTLCLFWRGRDGKIRAMPLTHKIRPVLISHLIENGTKFTPGQHFIAKVQRRMMPEAEALMLAVFQDVIESI